MSAIEAMARELLRAAAADDPWWRVIALLLQRAEADNSEMRDRLNAIDLAARLRVELDTMRRDERA